MIFRAFVGGCLQHIEMPLYNRMILFGDNTKKGHKRMFNFPK